MKLLELLKVAFGFNRIGVEFIDCPHCGSSGACIIDHELDLYECADCHRFGSLMELAEILLPAAGQ